MENLKRYNLSEFEKVREESDIPGNFTSVRGAYFIPGLNKMGFHKENGCMIGAKDDADLRELLASKIMDIIGIPHADIVPVYDENNNENGCLSLNILENDEEFMETISKYDSIVTVKDFINNDIEEISQLPNITPQTIESRRNYVIQYLYTSALLSNTDIKMDNRQIIYNQKTGKYRNPEYYDTGVSLISNENRCFFSRKSSEKILSEIYKDYAVEIFPLAQRVQQNLTKDRIDELLSDPIYDGFGKETKEDIVAGLNRRVNLITKYNHNILEHGVAEKPIDITQIKEEIQKPIDISFKDKVASTISNFTNKTRRKGIRDDNR